MAFNSHLINNQQGKNSISKDKILIENDTNDDSITTRLTEAEIDKQIAEGLDRANKLTGMWEQYRPHSDYYRTISDELDGRKVTLNGLKYPYEITEKDLFFSELVNSDLLGEVSDKSSSN